MKVITSTFSLQYFLARRRFLEIDTLHSLRQVYLCEKLSLTNEMYFAITLDRKTAGPVCHLSQILLYFAVHFIISISGLFLCSSNKSVHCGD